MVCEKALDSRPRLHEGRLCAGMTSQRAGALTSYQGVTSAKAEVHAVCRRDEQGPWIPAPVCTRAGCARE